MLHNNIGASETVEGRENAADGGSRPSLADSGREGKKRILTSFFLASPCFPYQHLFWHFYHCIHFSLSFLLLILSFPAVFIPLSYILTCDYLCLSPSTSPTAT